MVRSAKTWIWVRRIAQLKNTTVEGFPSGCLNASLGSGFIQYSSSHSMHKSTSKLRTCQPVIGGSIARVLHVLLILDCARPTEHRAQRAIHKNQHPGEKGSVDTRTSQGNHVPECPLQEFVFHTRNDIVCFLAVRAEVLRIAKTYANISPRDVRSRRAVYKNASELI